MMNFDGNVRVRADIHLGALLGEFVVHSHDIARALRHRWPIDRAQVPMVLDGVHQALPAWLKPDANSTESGVLELRLRGLGRRYMYAFAADSLTVDPEPLPRADVHIAEPITALLMTYRRINHWSAALAGKVTAWGRKPLLAFALPRRFLPA